MYFIVGLGNPGLRYKGTRHNFGFMILDRIAKENKLKFKKNGLSKITSFQIQSRDVILSKPLTFMNNSGRAVIELVKMFNPEMSRFLVLCDDLNLLLGKLRLRKNGSDGGHKGLASIIDCLGTSAFPRLRLGIGMNTNDNSADYVLRIFNPQEKPIVNSMIAKAVLAIEEFVLKGVEPAMNRFN